jgi:hypothetical protein
MVGIAGRYMSIAKGLMQDKRPKTRAGRAMLRDMVWLSGFKGAKH